MPPNYGGCHCCGSEEHFVANCPDVLEARERRNNKSNKKVSFKGNGKKYDSENDEDDEETENSMHAFASEGLEPITPNAIDLHEKLRVRF